MSRNFASLLASYAAVLGTASCFSVDGLAPSPATVSSFKELNGWSSGVYFDPRFAAFSPSLNMVADFHEFDGDYSGDYFDLKG